MNPFPLGSSQSLQCSCILYLVALAHAAPGEEGSSKSIVMAAEHPRKKKRRRSQPGRFIHRVLEKLIVPAMICYVWDSQIAAGCGTHLKTHGEPAFTPFIKCRWGNLLVITPAFGDCIEEFSLYSGWALIITPSKNSLSLGPCSGPGAGHYGISVIIRQDCRHVRHFSCVLGSRMPQGVSLPGFLGSHPTYVAIGFFMQSTMGGWDHHAHLVPWVMLYEVPIGPEARCCCVIDQSPPALSSPHSMRVK